jgi:NAD(P)-dependent dehydrogenase (short-subunit alcohol dehydrogenase family)
LAGGRKRRLMLRSHNPGHQFERQSLLMRIAISGVNRGIGEGLALAALDRGDKVIGFGRKAPSWADDSASAFRFIECDMAEAAELARASNSVADPIDVLVCSAASFASGAGTIEHFHPDAMREAFAVNVIAPLVMARALRSSLDAGNRRLIVMMSTGNASIEGNRTGTLLGYRLSKTALNQAARTLAAEWGPAGFTVVALNPGWVRTDMGGPNGELSIEQASGQIFEFIERVTHADNGSFVNTDGSRLPW